MGNAFSFFAQKSRKKITGWADSKFLVTMVTMVSIFCGHGNLLGGQFAAMGRLNLLGGQINLLGGQMPSQLTRYLPPWIKTQFNTENATQRNL